EFGNPHEFSGEGHLFRVKTEEEKHMKFYEIKEPYFALIVAENEKTMFKTLQGYCLRSRRRKRIF
ncbi:hypothetical protein T481_04025, partial [Enterococcus faecalis PF3]